MSDTNIDLSNVLFYQNPVDLLQTQNGSTQVDGVATEIYSCRGCNTNLAANNPASQYQRQKLIQNTVRVMSSLYSMNLALSSLNNLSKLTSYLILPKLTYFSPISPNL